MYTNFYQYYINYYSLSILFIPPSLGVGLPSANDESSLRGRGFQESRAEMDTWKGILRALQAILQKEREKSSEPSPPLDEHNH
jgi:hypothetical protein